MPKLKTANRWPAWQRVPPFLPVPLRSRANGWSEDKQAAFIGHLAETGSVAEAARRVGMSRMAAYRLRRCVNAGSFAHAWDAVIAARRGEEVPPRMVTRGELEEMVFEGPMVLRMFRGRFCFARREPSTSALLLLLKRNRGRIARRARRAA